MLWLYQRHALKAFRASVGDEEGHDSFTPPKKLNSRCSQAVDPPVLCLIIRTAPTQIQLLDLFAQWEFNPGIPNISYGGALNEITPEP